MHELTVEQEKQRSKVRTGASVSGVLMAIVVSFMSYFATPALDPVLRWSLIVALTAALGYFAFRTTYNNGVAKARCAKCGTPFTVREVERNETLLGTEERRQVEQLKPATKVDRGLDRVTTWTEEKVEVTAVDECMNCHDRNERTWTMTRDKNKVEEEVSA